MKKRILICAIMVIGITNTSFSTPSYDYDTTTEETLILLLNESIQPQHFTFNNFASVSFEGIYSIPQADINNNDMLNFSSIWAPSWDQDFNSRRPDWSNFKTRYKKHPHDKKWKGKPKPKPSKVPEPATILLFGSGLIGLAFISRIVKNKPV